VRAGLAVTITPRLLAGHLEGVQAIALSAAPARRLYALTPEVGARPLALGFVEALRAVVREQLRAVTGSSRSTPRRS
jgi:hypothetical protein